MINFLSRSSVTRLASSFNRRSLSAAVFVMLQQPAAKHPSKIHPKQKFTVEKSQIQVHGWVQLH